MKSILKIAAGGCILMAAVARADAARPNIVIIMADDLGYGDVGCFGCRDIPTPNIDGLAKAGVRFTDAHTYTVCSPTRAALLTGRYAENVGITTVLMGKSAPAFGRATTLAELLRDAGYATGLVGKWHLGYDGTTLPTRMGFDEFFGHLGGKIDYFEHTDSTQGGKHDLWEGTEEVFRDGYATDLFTERARQFIRDHAGGPFYLQLSYNAPHYPTKKGVYQAPDASLKRFDVTGDPNGTRGGYAAMVSCLDDGIGRVLDELRARKLEGTTLVIFLSDNGAERAGSNAPWSGGKHGNKEGGIRGPWVARWPGVIPAGLVCDDVVHVIDLTPTILPLAGAKPPAALRFDGVDVWSSFIGTGTPPERPIYFGKKTVRRGKWKLLDGRLYDLGADPGERTDVSAHHPEILREMTAELANAPGRRDD